MLARALRKTLSSSNGLVRKTNTDFKTRLGLIGNTTFCPHLKSLRELHLSTPKHDIDSAAKYVACGSCVVGAGGSAAGIGFIFGGLVQALARNPSAKGLLITYGLVGVAMTEAMAFITVGVGMTILFVL
ncbi:ATP synthase F(0) complex subunit C1, mitochondrial [Thelohanellus kitauei]|uniref:ATPase protein 9 n=1 Tax=Thelohanellus kitauei TaxID=669202 RepID=A0A0C2MMQ4_THEKT|nr:ATP synthase F(0) complex subunit C1, mitochondrial [Thelohanellus kitauei]